VELLSEEICSEFINEVIKRRDLSLDTLSLSDRGNEFSSHGGGD